MTLFESRKHRRAALREKEPDPEHVAIVERRFRYFEKLSDEDRRELLGHIAVFLAEKSFEGCAGLEITDDIRVTIAAQACLLLLHRDTEYFPECEVILVYPHDYRAKQFARAGQGAVIESEQGRLGESHQHGAVVLSWDAVRGGATNARDGRNVVIHEFAHQLDQEDGAADGAPVLASRAAYDPWAKTFGEEFARLKQDVDEGESTDIDAYGATNPAEFFAVVTEEFFEKPDVLVRNHPALYDQLASFYRQDPLARIGVVREAVEHVPVRAARASAVEPKAEAYTIHAGSLTVTLSDMSNHPRAEALVQVGDARRASMHAIGCKRAGFVGTLFVSSLGDSWGWVGEVMTAPDDQSVAAIYRLGSCKEGIAFWTLFEDGTILETETSEVAPSHWVRSRVLPLHPRRERFLAQWIPDRSPAALHALHVARVRDLVEREHLVPVTLRSPEDARRAHQVTRLRSIELRGWRMSRREHVENRVAFGLVVFFSCVGIGVLAAFAGWSEVLHKFLLAAVLSGVFGMFAMFVTIAPVSAVALRLRPGPLPARADTSLKRAASIGDAGAEQLAHVLEKEETDAAQSP